jgi:hypothetical protein
MNSLPYFVVDLNIEILIVLHIRFCLSLRNKFCLSFVQLRWGCKNSISKVVPYPNFVPVEFGPSCTHLDHITGKVIKLDTSCGIFVTMNRK